MDLICWLMHDPLQKFFDQLAAEWDLHFTAEDLERLSRLIDRIEIAEGMSILDLGCGTGVTFDLLRRKVGPSGLVTGVDFSLEMVQQAHRNFPFDNVAVVDADATHLPFGDSSFDLAVSFAAFPHFSDKQQALSEIDRVLKPQGRLYIIHLMSSKEIADTHHSIGGVVAHDELPNADQLRKMFERSHFDQVTIDDRPGLYVATAVNAK